MDCSGCTLCCLAGHLRLKSDITFEYCTMCDVNKGCKEYENRPNTCREYACFYQRENMTKNMHPNNSHILIEMEHDTFYITVDPEYKDNWRTNYIDDWIKELESKNFNVVIRNKE